MSKETMPLGVKKVIIFPRAQPGSWVHWQCLFLPKCWSQQVFSQTDIPDPSTCDACT